MAKVGQVVEVSFAVDLQAACHGRKHGTKAFAVATGITDLQLTCNLGLVAAQTLAVPGD